MRRRAGVARCAHNAKVGSASLPVASNREELSSGVGIHSKPSVVLPQPVQFSLGGCKICKIFGSGSNPLLDSKLKMRVNKAQNCYKMSHKFIHNEP